MRSARRTVSPRREGPAARGFWAEALAIVVMAVAILLVLSLASYSARDPVPWPLGQWSGEQEIHNIAGPVGALLAELLRQLLGHAAWTTPLLLLLVGWEIFWRRGGRALTRLAGYGLLVLSAAGTLHLVLDVASPGSTRAGGWLG
ncbi:MAG TPA: DNA translocase FtsK 4TM domain-containing protein, partial [Candidatus Polarisedimenticolia bacterium]|nr:DNA translocase FtsK 4TM domain-containing protein [Candidatus Polarisedimenticolia bacterium]